MEDIKFIGFEVPYFSKYKKYNWLKRIFVKYITRYRNKIEYEENKYNMAEQERYINDMTEMSAKKLGWDTFKILDIKKMYPQTSFKQYYKVKISK